MKKKKKKNIKSAILENAFPGCKKKIKIFLLIIVLAFFLFLSLGNDLMFRILVFFFIFWILLGVKKIQKQLEVCSE